MFIIFGIAAVALIASTVAFASTLTTTATVTGAGALALNMPSNPSISATLAGDDQTVNYSPALGLVDARGTGTGWNLTMSATTFTDGASHTLAAGTVTSAAQACHSGSTCTAATNSVTGYPLTLSGTAVKVFNATSGSGLGKVDVTPTVQVAIPGNAYAGTYTSTVTVSAVAGP
jgi:hypothetical protein